MYPNYNPYFGMPNYQQMQAQPIQKMEQKSPQATCFFVDSVNSFNVDALPGIYYLGINEKANEIYMRKVNELGNPELKTYKLSEEKKEKTELQKINDKLLDIEKMLGEKNANIAGNKTDNN